MASLSATRRAAEEAKAGPSSTRIPAGELHKKYVGTIVAVSKSDSRGSIDQAFLRKIITNNGGTPSSPYLSDLLAQALGELGLPVSKYLNENLLTLNQNLP
ncbi:MAG: hypothetical protein G01um10147_784 [Microgenomates group bacterium Gr01-1014_7]|nr:MAG: hypothetical protein G01um10147_784 [Microgenomates group bacterium Gr01-1014_7]